MGRKILTSAQLEVTKAMRSVLEDAEERGLDVRIGLSGGADSLALAASSAYLGGRKFIGLTIESLTIDHGLQDGSDQVAAKVVTLAKNLGLKASSKKVQVTQNGEGMEAAARSARLDALTSGFSGLLVLGHSLDDQAETVLLGLARGSGIRSLAGIAEQSQWNQVEIRRPLLAIRRAVIRQATIDWGLEIWDDPQNQQEQFSRVRVRYSTLPKLENDLGPGIAEALARSAFLARQDADALDAIANQALEFRQPSLEVTKLVQLQPAIISRIIKSWLGYLGVDQPTFNHIQAVVELVTKWRGQQGVDLPGGIRVRRFEGKLISLS